MSKKYFILILFNLAYIIGFFLYYLSLRNYEFILYILVLVTLLITVIFIQKRVKFSHTILWMLSIWGLLHMMGGGVHWPNEQVLYKWIPIEIYRGEDAEFVILKFDQILHFYIYFVISFILSHLLYGKLKIKKIYFYTFIALGSTGVSVINELIEFSAVVFLGDTGVGGYYNTMLDFVFNALGAVFGAIIYSFLKNKK